MQSRHMLSTTESSPRPIETFLLRAGAAATLAVALLALSAMTNPVLADTPTLERQRELTRFVRQECGFCHGLKLTGGLGATLTAEAMREKPADTLEAVIQHGIPGTAMPPWAPYLSQADTHWIVDQLQKGFPQ